MTRIRRRAAVIVTALTAALLTTGCDMEPTVTKQQAIERVAQRAQESFAQLPPGATLVKEFAQDGLPCDDGNVMVETDYNIAFSSGWPVDQTIATLAKYWESAGYKVARDDRSSPDVPELVVEHPDDGFQLGILVARGSDGTIKATLRSSSSCVKP
ncbi:hypothetical protein EV385_1109 [Krasilnikovia cinnamomea]|uniref:LppA-like lipoprotein n=1 Tax=Krasilnikovia cinnamomea TaxID=349313 RepID=A0A4Q7ZH17_9ACTN|nr:hypothetical protein [Krasilnikovia cinnamomea]RZU49359.1 hypothetical protein EV385_1109 [Krasilnikovia cinnamomea]